MKQDTFNTVKYRIDGVWYSWSGWFGCQLKSIEPRRLQIGSLRRILNHDMAVYNIQRIWWFRYETSWSIALPTGPGKIDEANTLLHALQNDLKAIT